jgi:hypothetical protein
MSQTQLLARIADLHRAIEALPVPEGRGAKAFESLEELKHGLDNARLALWARLQGVDSDDAPGYVRSFRVKRAVEISTRLTTDLRLGLLDSRHGEYTALLTAALELASAIHTGRVRPAESAD